MATDLKTLSSLIFANCDVIFDVSTGVHVVTETTTPCTILKHWSFDL